MCDTKCQNIMFENINFFEQIIVILHNIFPLHSKN